MFCQPIKRRINIIVQINIVMQVDRKYGLTVSLDIRKSQPTPDSLHAQSIRRA